MNLGGEIFEINKTDKPIFLQVTASWCAPCKAEILIVLEHNSRVYQKTNKRKYKL